MLPSTRLSTIRTTTSSGTTRSRAGTVGREEQARPAEHGHRDRGERDLVRGDARLREPVHEGHQAGVDRPLRRIEVHGPLPRSHAVARVRQIVGDGMGRRQRPIRPTRSPRRRILPPRGQVRRSASRAASIPLIPWTPPPGGVDDEHRNSDGSGRRVRVPAHDRPEEQLAPVADAAVDVAADVVGVVGLHRRRVLRCSGPGPGPGSPGAKRSTCASIAAVMSVVDPLGTWQYAQATCLPAGARVGSASVGWTSRTKGRSAMRPRPTASSEAATSRYVPPRWTVRGAGRGRVRATGSGRPAPSRP